MNLFERSYQRYYSLRVFSWPRTNLHPDGNPGKSHSTERKGNFNTSSSSKQDTLCHKNVTKFPTLNPHHLSWRHLRTPKGRGVHINRTIITVLYLFFFPLTFPFFPVREAAAKLHVVEETDLLTHLVSKFHVEENSIIVFLLFFFPPTHEELYMTVIN